MSESSNQEQNSKIELKIQTKNPKLDAIIFSYSFYFLSDKFDILKMQNLLQSEALIMDQYPKYPQKCDFFIIGFKKTIIIIKESLISYMKNFFSTKSEMPIYTLSNIAKILNQKIKVKNNIIKASENFKAEICNFNEYLLKFTNPVNHQINQMHSVIKSCISGYLILESYSKLLRSQKVFSYQTENIENNFNELYALPNKIFDQDNFIELRTIGTGSAFRVSLLYEIENGELFAFKSPISTNEEIEKLVKREYNNYKLIKHPQIPKFYGEIQKKGFIIQFIKGQTLLNIKEMNLNFNEKITIIFQILLIFEYFHGKSFVYRDLKPNNIIIDEDKRVFIIDFDRMIKITEENKDLDHTKDFSQDYMAPEAINGVVSCKNDIYSIGKIILYIMNEQISNTANIKIDNNLNLIYQNTQKNHNERPSILELIRELYANYFQIINESLNEKINFDKVKYLNEIVDYGIKNITQNIYKSIHYFEIAASQNHSIANYNLGVINYEGKYIKQNINKAFNYLSLASNQNHPIAQYDLGVIYYEGKYVTRNINKAIYYYTLSANQNYIEAQFNLGVIYFEDNNITHDINKAIHYYTIAADQNHKNAQFNLGLIYCEGKYITRDINKSIHYFSLASNQNHSDAQYNLGVIYHEGNHVKRDINKAIHYFTLAANQNHSDAQYNLGVIYNKLNYIKRDINKAIYYYTLAANQNHTDAQYAIGLIYHEGNYATQDINKAIHYYQLAANGNHPIAQFNLGVFYYEGKYIKQDINKSIYYFSLAANQHHINAQYNLGLINYEGKYIKQDINKAIHYYTLAANQNHSDSQYILGAINYEGIYIIRDINKAIHYLSLASNQNHSDSQYILGVIYYEGKYVKRDINKAIHYYTLSANQNYINAQFNLGVIYFEDKYITQDINKAIHYYTLATDRNHSDAQYNLGLIYYEGIYIARDINKSIHYFTLASNRNHPDAQFFLSQYNIYVKSDINKGIDLLIRSSSNGNKISCLYVAFFYHEGKYIKRDIGKCITYYKEASSFNLKEAKNNLGIIYKHGYKNIGKAMEYFKEAIRRFNDILSMYNLAHIYIYEYANDNRIEKSIDLLTRSLNRSFYPSANLLCIVLIKKNKFNYEDCLQNLLNRTNDHIFSMICRIIEEKNLMNHKFFDEFYQLHKTVDYLYMHNMTYVQSKEVYKEVQTQSAIIRGRNITDDFYQGFNT